MMKRKTGPVAPDGESSVKKAKLAPAADFVEDSAGASVTSEDSRPTIDTPNNVPTPATAMTEPSDTDGYYFYDNAFHDKRPSDVKRIPCPIPGCNSLFNRQARLEAHLRSHNGQRPFACTYDGCNKAYTDNKYLLSHIKSAHLKVSKFVCDICGKGFATGQRLKRHADVHEAEERFRCRDFPPCNQTFRKRKTLERHVLKEHEGSKPFACTNEGCGESYGTLNALKAHTERAHGEEKFMCGVCNEKVAQDPSLAGKVLYAFTTKVALELHIRRDHVNCVHCGNGIPFTGQYELERHIDTHHTDLTVKERKVVECEYEGCNKRFVKRGNMLIHYRTAHEGLRHVCGGVDVTQYEGLEDWPWQTEGCGATFTSKVGAATHALHVHLGLQRPEYKQQDSPKSKEYNIMDELSGVTNLLRRPIPCTVEGCPARFVRWGDMHSHVAVDHPEVVGSSQLPQSQDALGFFDQQGPLTAQQQQGFSQQVQQGEMIQQQQGFVQQGQQGEVIQQRRVSYEQDQNPSHQMQAPDQYNQQGQNSGHQMQAPGQFNQNSNRNLQAMNQNLSQEDLAMLELIEADVGVNPLLLGPN